MGKLSDQNKIDVVNRYLAGKETAKQLGKDFGVSTVAICNLLKRRGIQPKRLNCFHPKYSLNEDYFDDINTEEKAYLLGLLFADGCNYPKYNRVTIGLQEGDVSILHRFAKEIESDRPLWYRKPNGNTKGQYKFEMYSKKLCKSLASKGCVPKKSLILEFPTSKQVPRHLLRHFVRGYFDGDGCLYTYGKSRIKCNVVSTKMFCKALKGVVKSELGIDSKVYKKHTNGVTAQFFIYKKQDCISFLDWMYKDCTIALDRKYEKYRSI